MILPWLGVVEWRRILGVALLFDSIALCLWIYPFFFIRPLFCESCLEILQSSINPEILCWGHHVGHMGPRHLRSAMTQLPQKPELAIWLLEQRWLSFLLKVETELALNKERQHRPQFQSGWPSDLGPRPHLAAMWRRVQLIHRDLGLPCIGERNIQKTS